MKNKFSYSFRYTW